MRLRHTLIVLAAGALAGAVLGGAPGAPDAATAENAPVYVVYASGAEAIEGEEALPVPSWAETPSMLRDLQDGDNADAVNARASLVEVPFIILQASSVLDAAALSPGSKVIWLANNAGISHGVLAGILVDEGVLYAEPGSAVNVLTSAPGIDGQLSAQVVGIVPEAEWSTADALFITVSIVDGKYAVASAPLGAAEYGPTWERLVSAQTERYRAQHEERLLNDPDYRQRWEDKLADVGGG